eukprot:6195697-Pleurochrysis_carterae.AAC.2
MPDGSRFVSDWVRVTARVRTECASDAFLMGVRRGGGCMMKRVGRSVLIGGLVMRLAVLKVHVA